MQSISDVDTLAVVSQAIPRVNSSVNTAAMQPTGEASHRLSAAVASMDVSAIEHVGDAATKIPLTPAETGLCKGGLTLFSHVSVAF